MKNLKRLLWPALALGMELGCSSVVPPVGLAYAPVTPGPNTPSITGGNTAPSAPPPAISALDTAVARGIRRELHQDQRLAAAAKGISVSASKGVVTLTGTVPTDQDRIAIIDRVQELPGVDGVDDQLVALWPSVSGPPPARNSL